ncbi:chaperonin [Rouxiella sp. T17]|uniref:chaperonin n=1 Tax=Rouxiella sp. T17 TaxID=3085684 RepID=UPI002FCBFA6B
MKYISERIEHVGKGYGYCVICGTQGRLSKDHVPPSCAIVLEPMLQKSVSEFYSPKEKIKPLNAKTGSYFQTVCEKCNNGINDNSIASVTSQFRAKLLRYLSGEHFMYNTIRVEVDSLNFARAMISHVLSATSARDCEKKPSHSEFYTPLREFVLGIRGTLEDTHDIYYWFYPFRMHISAQNINFYNNGHHCFCAVLHFFPIAFLITLAKQGTHPVHASKLEMQDKNLHFNMIQSNMDYATFPFVRLEGNQMNLFSSGHTCVSYPINKN